QPTQGRPFWIVHEVPEIQGHDVTGPWRKRRRIGDKDPACDRCTAAMKARRRRRTLRSGSQMMQRLAGERGRMSAYDRCNTTVKALRGRHALRRGGQVVQRLVGESGRIPADWQDNL